MLLLIEWRALLRTDPQGSDGDVRAREGEVPQRRRRERDVIGGRRARANHGDEEHHPVLPQRRECRNRTWRRRTSSGRASGPPLASRRQEEARKAHQRQAWLGCSSLERGFRAGRRNKNTRRNRSQPRRLPEVRERSGTTAKRMRPVISNANAELDRGFGRWVTMAHHEPSLELTRGSIR